MKEDVLRQFFEGHVTATDLARDLVSAVERERVPPGAPGVSRVRITDMAEDFEVRPAHLVKIVDAALDGALGPDELEAIGFCLEASEHFVWDVDTPEGRRVADAAFWLDSPEINYPLTPAVLAKIRHYLVTGEDTLTRADARGKCP